VFIDFAGSIAGRKHTIGARAADVVVRLKDSLDDKRGKFSPEHPYPRRAHLQVGLVGGRVCEQLREKVSVFQSLTGTCPKVGQHAVGLVVISHQLPSG
jgi:hypothetical protein